MELYKIVHDQEQLNKFIQILPELDKFEVYVMSLMVRKKHFKHVSNNKDNKLVHVLVRDKDRIIQEIEKMEIPLGKYKLYGTEVPQEALSLYINPNPRSLEKATKELGAKIWKYSQDGNFDIDRRLFSIISKSKSYTKYSHYDIDSKDIDLTLIDKVLLSECYHIVETKGGYHILVDHRKATSHNTQLRDRNRDKSTGDYPINWHAKIISLYNIDKIEDQMVPIPGCIQGNFIPRFVKL